VKTAGQGDAHDITEQMHKAIAGCGRRIGIGTVFVVGSTSRARRRRYGGGGVCLLGNRRSGHWKSKAK
jgi:hypothetical protein